MATSPATDASTRSASSTSSAPRNVHGGHRWTPRGHRSAAPLPVKTTETTAKQDKSRSPLTDSNRRPPPYHRTSCRRQRCPVQNGGVPESRASVGLARNRPVPAAAADNDRIGSREVRP